MASPDEELQELYKQQDRLDAWFVRTMWTSLVVLTLVLVGGSLIVLATT